MCHYNVLKCVRCRKVQPLGTELCEKFDQGSICVDERKLTGNPARFREAQNRVRSSVGGPNTSYESKHGALAVDLFEILPHKYVYQDGCFSCSG